MDYTLLEENGIQDQQEEFDYLNMDSTLYTPAVLLYFNDDLHRSYIGRDVYAPVDSDPFGV